MALQSTSTLLVSSCCSWFCVALAMLGTWLPCRSGLAHWPVTTTHPMHNSEEREVRLHLQPTKKGITPNRDSLCVVLLFFVVTGFYFRVTEELVTFRDE